MKKGDIEAEKSNLKEEIKKVQKIHSMMSSEYSGAFVDLLQEWEEYYIKLLIRLDPFDKNLAIEFAGLQKLIVFLKTRNINLTQSEQQLEKLNKQLWNADERLEKMEKIEKGLEKTKF